MNYIAFGKKLKELREKSGQGQSDLGDILGVGIKQIQRYEAGELLPDHEKVALLIKQYKYDFLSLIYDVPHGNRLEDPHANYNTNFKEKYISSLDQVTSLERENARLKKDLDLSLGEIRHNILLGRAIAETTQDLVIEFLAKQRKMTFEELAVSVGKANFEKYQKLKEEGNFAYVGK